MQGEVCFYGFKDGLSSIIFPSSELVALVTFVKD